MKIEATFSVTPLTIEKRIKRSISAKAAYKNLAVSEIDGKTTVIGSREDVGMLVYRIEVSLGESWLLCMQRNGS